MCANTAGSGHRGMYSLMRFSAEIMRYEGSDSGAMGSSGSEGRVAT